MAENVKKFKTFDGVEHDLEDTQARADIADIAANTYTKTEIDSRLTGYAEKTDVYDKTESYSKTEVDDALALKANAADVYAKADTYDKTEVDSALTLKANVVDVYSKTETYNKTETDGLLGDKANSADVYTITQTDALLDTKCGIDDSSTTATAMTWSASKLNVDFNGKADSSDVYTKAEVDALLEGSRMKCYYTTVTINDKNEHTVDISSLNLQSADDYFVIINGGEAPADYSGGTYNGGANHSVYVSSKTATSFGVKAEGSGLVNFRGPANISCQVIY